MLQPSRILKLLSCEFRESIFIWKQYSDFCYSTYFNGKINNLQWRPTVQFHHHKPLHGILVEGCVSVTWGLFSILDAWFVGSKIWRSTVKSICTPHLEISICVNVCWTFNESFAITSTGRIFYHESFLIFFFSFLNTKCCNSILASSHSLKIPFNVTWSHLSLLN